MPSSVTTPMTSRAGLPAPEVRQDVVFVLLLGDDDHALLRLAEHDLAARHAGLAPRHQRHVDLDAGVAACGALDQRRGQAGGAAVLQADDPVGVVLGQVDAGLHEQLLEERVAHLHGRAAAPPAPPRRCGRRARWRRRCRRGRVGADEHDRVADAARHGAQQAIAAGDADAHGVDQRVAVVRGRNETSPPTVGMPRQLP